MPYLDPIDFGTKRPLAVPAGVRHEPESEIITRDTTAVCQFKQWPGLKRCICIDAGL